MASDLRQKLPSVNTFPALVELLHEELDWPITTDDFDDATFDYTPEELGLDSDTAAKIQEIKRLRPLTANQPWGVFFVKFEPKRLPVVALRRILNRLVAKKRASANSADRRSWEMDDLMFVSSFGESDERQISFAHFSPDGGRVGLPTLKVLGWDNLDTPLHLDHVAEMLETRLVWPDDDKNLKGWREAWRSAFTIRHREVITTSQNLAIRLAELARSIRHRILTVLQVEASDGGLKTLMSGFQQALLHDLEESDFADMYAQTIAYGLLSARITNSAGSDKILDLPVTNPFVRELMETFLQPDLGGDQQLDFDELGVGEVVDLLDAVNIQAVIRNFGDQNPDEDPVIHFYELFLKEYDADKRMQRGVFYTPRPVVTFIVRSVDELLRNEFGLDDGLADLTTWAQMVEDDPEADLPAGVSPDDPFVRILDPATGTGTFLVEAIRVIHTTLIAKWQGQGLGSQQIETLWNEYVPQHLLPRLYGYEVLMAPYAIAHLKVGLALLETGYRFEGHERARIYLTNSLEPPEDVGDQFEFAVPALAHEVAAVNEIKRTQGFTVVVGNPPYSQMSQNLTETARDLVSPYRYVDGVRIVERGAISLERNLQDDYVKFIRLAEMAISDSGTGVMGYITNHSYRSNVTLRGVRASLVGSFDRIQLLDLHGSSQLPESSPDGAGNENVFEIQQGVAITLMAKGVKSGELRQSADLWGTRSAKYDALLDSGWTPSWDTIEPKPELYLFRPRDHELADEYSFFPSVQELMPLHGSAITTGRDGFVVDFNDEGLLERAALFQDRSIPDDEVKTSLGVRASSIWDVAEARKRFRNVDPTGAIVDVDYRPFDTRRLLYHDAVVSSPRHPTMDHLAGGSTLALAVCRQQGVAGFQHVFVSRRRFDEGLVSNRSREKTYCFPLYVVDEPDGLLGSSHKVPNIDGTRLADWTSTLGPEFLPGRASRTDRKTVLSPENILSYIYAVLHSTGYRLRYAEELRLGFPRIPCPRSPELLEDLTEHGRTLIESHLLDSKIPASSALTGDGPALVGSPGWLSGVVWLDPSGVAPRSGYTARNPGLVGFTGVSEEAWTFRIGAYQVLHKWLKDRKGSILSERDIRHYLRMVEAITKTLDVMNDIDLAIAEHGGWPDAFVLREADAVRT